jgi:putative membrane protein
VPIDDLCQNRGQFSPMHKDIPMLETTMSSLSGLPPFLAYFAVAIVLTLIFVRIYTWLTPQDELALIRTNNTAAALAFGGALIGFALPLSSAITHSLSLLDCAIWGAVALIVQSLTFVVLRFTLKQLPERIQQGEIATGVFVAAVAIAVGMINAACMSY